MMAATVELWNVSAKHTNINGNYQVNAGLTANQCEVRLKVQFGRFKWFDNFLAIKRAIKVRIILPAMLQLYPLQT